MDSLHECCDLFREPTKKQSKECRGIYKDICIKLGSLMHWKEIANDITIERKWKRRDGKTFKTFEWKKWNEIPKDTQIEITKQISIMYIEGVDLPEE